MAVKITADKFDEGDPWASLPRFTSVGPSPLLPLSSTHLFTYSLSFVELSVSMWKKQLQSILLEDPGLNGKRVRIEHREFLEGTLYYLEQTEEVANMLPINSRASTLVEVTIHGDAGTSFRYHVFHLPEGDQDSQNRHQH